MYKRNLLHGIVFVVATLALVLNVLGTTPSTHAAAANRTLVAPTSVTVTRSAPDANGGIWVHTERAWVTKVKLSKSDAQGNHYANLSPGQNPYSCVESCTGCGDGYTTLDNKWAYIIGPIWFLAIDFNTQDHWDNCNNTVTHMYTDPQCVGYQNSTCSAWTTGVFHDVNCNQLPTNGTCNQDWGDVNTKETWDGNQRWQYLRTWVDIYGAYKYVNNVG